VSLHAQGVSVEGVPISTAVRQYMSPRVTEWR
jgi:hypothetical protein